MIDTILKEIKPKMKAAIENFKLELSRIRTGRANPSILDGVTAIYYGAKTSIKELASITVPEPNQIVVKPWDRSSLNDIETAIRNSNLGISPINDGQQIRLILPPMTEERRREIATTVKKLGEETKVSLRNVRREAWDKVQAAEKAGQATEDDRRWAEEELNKQVTEFNSEVDLLIAEKEQDVMKI
ncbi:MAG: ribosome recycling factor [Candidatus Berkelbacteria bacterium]|nr:ribosome recycling factor [Candidatus Berkelbacteria bacterium]